MHSATFLSVHSNALLLLHDLAYTTTRPPPRVDVHGNRAFRIFGTPLGAAEATKYVTCVRQARVCGHLQQEDISIPHCYLHKLGLTTSSARQAQELDATTTLLFQHTEPDRVSQ